MANLKIGGAHNEAGQKFFASNLLTTDNTNLYWDGNVVIHTGNFTVGNGLSGNGSQENPLTLNLQNFYWEWDSIINGQGHRVEAYSFGDVSISALSLNLTSDNDIELHSTNDFFLYAANIYLNNNSPNTANGLAIVGENGKLPSSILPEQTNIDLSDAVLRYPATVDTESKVVTVTDGTPVEDIRIGDEIVTADGVYKKTKDSITTGSPADGTRIKVSGITSPAEANGVYILTETDRKWKHESADYWISEYSSPPNPTTWMISAVENAVNPGSSLFFGHISTSPSPMPWDITMWDQRYGAEGTPVLENASTEQVITDTIDLFEYASLPIEPENIVQSVNGNKPDSSGNVTVEVTGAVDAEFFETGDYNDFTEPGIYYISGYYGECPNAPDNYSYMLRVEKVEKSNFSRIFQIANRYVDSDDDDKQAIFIRNGYRESEGVEIIWNSWQSLSSGGGSITTTPPLMFTVPSSDSGLHLEITAGKLADGTDNAALINTATSADHRAKVLGNSGGTDWIACPDTGFGTNFAGWPVKVDVTGLLDPSEISYIRYRWVPTTGDPSDWYAMVYPCATEAPVLSPGGSSGDTTELENRVSDLEETVGSLNSTVDEILADYGEGTGALVYRVVASATEPENPTEGMIWIQTE